MSRQEELFYCSFKAILNEFFFKRAFLYLTFKKKQKTINKMRNAIIPEEFSQIYRMSGFLSMFFVCFFCTRKKRVFLEHVCKVRCFYSQKLNIGAVLQCFFKPLQNRSEKLKTSAWATKFCIWQAFYSDFERPHAKHAIKMHTFGGRGAEGPKTLQKQWFGTPGSLLPQRGHHF